VRDPKRIKSLLKELERLWKLVPDWRFGQLFVNVMDISGNTDDPFFVEDDKMLAALECTRKQVELHQKTTGGDKKGWD